MFKNNNKARSNASVQEYSGSQPAVNMISEGTEISGIIKTKNDFRISGQVDGELEIKGKCIVTQTGKINGDIVALDADISGVVDGRVTTGNRLILRSSAHVTGDIRTKVILVEEGAIFEGACKMSNEPVSDKMPAKSSFNGVPKNGSVADTKSKSVSKPVKETAGEE
ncbi:MAG: polymer-forming cytoskeletal protein [Balneolales bacterium]|nr:polymer-forming cytoskeletal protein [Balneolales bacterium]